MSEIVLASIGALLFAVTATATLLFGYLSLARAHARDRALGEQETRADAPTPEAASQPANAG